MGRNQQLQIRVSQEEKDLYQNDAHKIGLGVCEWFRDLADRAVGAKALKPKREKRQERQKKEVTETGIVVPKPFRPKVSPEAFETKRSSLMDNFIKKGGAK